MNIQKIMGIPKSILYNIRIFGIIKGITLPILFSNNTKLYGIRKNSIVISTNKSRIFIGFGGTAGINASKHTEIILGKTGKIVFNGNAIFSSGTVVRVDNGICTFGDNFNCNKNCFISCAESITFGNDCLLGWNVNIRDSDGHSIFENHKQQVSKKSVNIGNNVWIASNVDILKGVFIGNNNVIGYRSCVTKSIFEEHCLIAGYPAKVLKRNIEWKC